MRKTTLGIIVGNRGFFPDHLCETGRAEILRVLEEEGTSAVHEALGKYKGWDVYYRAGAV